MTPDLVEPSIKTTIFGFLPGRQRVLSRDEIWEKIRDIPRTMKVDEQQYREMFRRLTMALAQRGLKPSAASKAAGLGPDFIRDKKRGLYIAKYRHWPKDDAFKALAKVLDLSVDYLKCETDDPSPSEIHEPRPAAIIDSTAGYRPMQNGNVEFRSGMAMLPGIVRNVPIKRNAGRGAREGILMADDVVDFAPRTAAIEKANNVWAFVMIDRSMEPAYELGANVYVNPDRPIEENEFAIFALKAGADVSPALTEYVFAKFLRRTNSHFVVEQLTPHRQFKISIASVVSALRVISHKELLS